MKKGSLLNIRGKEHSSMLSKKLQEEYKVRSMPIKKGDTVQVMRGRFKGIEGTVTQVNTTKGSVSVEGATQEKADGTVIFIPIHSSKLAITRINLEDPRRKDILDRRVNPRR